MKNLLYLLLMFLLLTAGCKEKSKPSEVINETEEKLMKAYQDSLKSEKTPYDPPTHEDAFIIDSLGKPKGNGKFGCIPRAWINLDASNYFHFKPWFGDQYIFFDHAYIHEAGSQDHTLKDDMYLVASQSLLENWNNAINQAGVDKSKIRVGICSKPYRENNMNIFDKGAVFENDRQLYPPLSTCNCYVNCDTITE